MRTQNLWIKVGVAAIAIFGASATAIACSGDDNKGNPTPSGEDAAADQTSSSGSSTAGSSTSGASSGSSTTGSSTSGSSSGSSTTGSSTSGSGDSGCVQDATPNCSSCATDPYNACSAFTVNCVPFNNSVLPSPYPHF